jgi:N-acetylglutamate synthase-like GNAT family acetyltransferase
MNTKDLGNSKILILLFKPAGDFFLRFGFYAVDRPKVPSSVQKSVEFTSVCPKSALAMEMCLDSHQGSVGVME